MFIAFSFIFIIKSEKQSQTTNLSKLSISSSHSDSLETLSLDQESKSLQRLHIMPWQIAAKLKTINTMPHAVQNAINAQYPFFPSE